MKTKSINTGTALSRFGLILVLSAMPLLLSVTGCSTSNRPNQTTGDRNKDHGTSSRVMMALAEDTEYEYSAVNVETLKGTVQLSGIVKSRDQRNRAGDLAEKISGKEVINHITVNGVGELSP